MPTKPAPVKKLTVTRAAELLGVTRTHLSYVLHGHRQSRRLTARYTALLQQVSNGKPTPAAQH